MTTCWILRLPCKTEANFSISAAGYALDHNVFVRLTMSLEDCKIHCMYTNNCQSLNYKVSGSENCELNRETNVSKPKDLVKKSDWTYYATNQKTTQVSLLNSLLLLKCIVCSKYVSSFIGNRQIPKWLKPSHCQSKISQ